MHAFYWHLPSDLSDIRMSVQVCSIFNCPGLGVCREAVHSVAKAGENWDGNQNSCLSQLKNVCLQYSILHSRAWAHVSNGRNHELFPLPNLNCKLDHIITGWSRTVCSNFTKNPLWVQVYSLVSVNRKKLFLARTHNNETKSSFSHLLLINTVVEMWEMKFTIIIVVDWENICV